jgi:hypothetical protein
MMAPPNASVGQRTDFANEQPALLMPISPLLAEGDFVDGAMTALGLFVCCFARCDFRTFQLEDQFQKGSGKPGRKHG